MSTTLKRHIGNALFVFYILIITVDPTNTITHLKNLAFVLLLGYNIAVYKPDTRMLPLFLLIFCPVLLGFISASMQMNPMLPDETVAYFKAIAPFVLLFWVRYYDVVRLTFWPAVLATIIYIVLYSYIAQGDEAVAAAHVFAAQHNRAFMLGHRSFLGFTVLGLYCNSVYCLFMLLYATYYRWFQHKSLWRLLPVVLFSFPFLVGGTRMTMLTPFALMGVVAHVLLLKSGRIRYLAYPLLLLFLLGFVAIVVLLATEQGQASNEIKYGHIGSYLELFTIHPEYLVIGQGPGTEFYSHGFGRMAVLTEWSYLEVVRNYGLGSLLIFSVFFLPLYLMYRHRESDYVRGAMWAYLIYLLVAGTNPLLMNSTGAFVLLCAYSVVCRAEEKEKSALTR